MSEKFEKQYPRIFSLSTIGLIHHYNMDYIFHPFRTDFSGEAGIGKTTIANLLQLIFVGNKHFKPASNSNYKPSGYVMKTKHINFGYAFLNIEIEKGKFVVIGIFLKAGNSHVEHFIIQNAFKEDNIEGFDKPILYKRLLEAGHILDLNELIEKNKHIFNIEKFEVRKFQEILKINEILPFSLHDSEENVIRFAKILRSFSAGKDIQWKKSSDIQYFLFGNDDYNRIKKEYDEGIIEVESKYQSSYKNDEDIENVTERAEAIQELAALYATKKETEKEDRIARNVYWYFRKKELEIDISEKENLQWTIATELKLLEKEEYNEKQQKLREEIVKIEVKFEKLQKIKVKVNRNSENKLKEEKVNIQKELLRVTPLYNNIQITKNLFDEYNSEKQIKQVFEFFIQWKEVIRFEDYLNKKSKDKTDFLNEFQRSAWIKSFKEGEKEYANNIKEIENQIKELNSLKAFSNFDKVNSLIKWSIDKLAFTTFSKIQECVIAHYFELGLNKPEDQKRKRYIPRPEELLQAINSEENITEDENGFWLNLSGIKEYIEYRDIYFLNVSNAKEKIKQYAEKTDIRIKELEEEKLMLNDLYQILNEYENRKIFTFYKDKEGFFNQDYPEIFEDISNQDNFNKLMLCFEDKVSITNDYEKWTNKNEELINQEIELVKLKDQKVELEDFLNNNKQDDKQLKINKIDVDLNKIVSELIELQKDNRFNKISIDLTKKVNDKAEDINTLWKKRIETKSKIDGEVGKLKELLEIAESEYDTAESECKLFNYEVDKNFLKDRYTKEPEKSEKEKDAYNEHCSYLTKTYFPKNSINRDTKDYKTLVETILPNLYANVKFEEKSVIEEIKRYLQKINNLAKDINSLFVQLLTKRFQDVIDAYQKYNVKYKSIKVFFSQKDVEITGGYKVKLTFDDVPDFPTSFLNEVKGELNNQMCFTGGMFLENLPKQKDIEKIILDIYKKHSRKDDVSVLDLLNPMNYFKMEFRMEKNGKENDGSTGQNYTKIALLCIAQMSEIYKDKQNKPPKGIRFMPIDDAQDLGGNYDMLYTIAANEDFQLLTFSITPLDDNENNNQNWYILNENKEEDKINNPPFAILSGSNETIYNWEKFLEENFYEKKA
ncbi:hypothetical protein GQR60_15070 [Labilibaculum sp. A4]|uniref:hypothetical protein n=1 Tax=Labilibaculum euxinus TaxID=2686357 RepID=UPI000F61D272|nr:hypothetical protein [Labilibaculum euxinus]MDQ1770127.1 hypothetical protein [Labilibaculum euxinus]MWN77661.1 hypothetical protein [Labilibaculum euxinus]